MKTNISLFIALAFLILCVPAQADLETFDASLGTFTSFDNTSGALNHTFNGSAGRTGGGMVLTAAGGSNVGVKQYAVVPNTLYMVTASIQVQPGGTAFWFEVGVKSGAQSAANFDTAAGTWFIPGKWESGTTAGNDSQWTPTANTWKTIGCSVLSGPADTVLTFGLKLGGAASPAVHVDDIHVTVAQAAQTINFDENPYVAFTGSTDGHAIDNWGQAKNMPAGSLIPVSGSIYHLACPGWMGEILNNGGQSSRDTTLVVSGSAWRISNTSDWGDASLVLGPLTTTPAGIYVANFWMVRAAVGADAWTNVGNDYNCHIAWRLADNPLPAGIEGWPGAVSADAFHLLCEGNSNTERNYAPDIYTTGSGATLECKDPTGSRYTSMAFEAVDASTWFESCIRIGNGGGASKAGYYVVDDFRLLTHGSENLDVNEWSLY